MANTTGNQLEDQKILDVVAEGERLIREAEDQIAKKQKLYSDINLDPEGCRRFLQGDRLTGEQKAQARKEIQEFKDEVERDNLDAVEHVKSGRKKAPRPSPGKIKI